jgi:phosphopantothenoylcysteine decarboxylase/phosphopantothenate--cysteine ligase
MEDPDVVIAQARFLLSRSAPLRGKKIIVTAGGTREAIDPVRFLSNRSSGKQGYAIAQAALDMGSDVTLISAPTSLTPPYGCHLITIESAEQMLSSVLDHIPDAHALIMSAAVADFRPAAVSRQKIKKESGLDTLELEATSDILVKVAEEKKKKGLDLKIVGFAAESENLKANAVKKMKAKHMDMIVANDISSARAGFGVDTNEVLLIFADGSIEKLPLMPKIDVAEKIIQHLTAWLIEGAS